MQTFTPSPHNLRAAHHVNRSAHHRSTVVNLASTVGALQPGDPTGFSHRPAKVHGPLFRDGTAPSVVERVQADASARHMSRRVPPVPKHFTIWTGVLPLATSPDGRSLVRVGHRALDSDTPCLFVAHLDLGAWSALPIDSRHVLLKDPHEIDAHWLNHHYDWQRGNPDGGPQRDQLVARANVAPMPRRGIFVQRLAQYTVNSATGNLRAAFADFLIRRFQAEAVAPVFVGDHVLMFRVQGMIVRVAEKAIYCPANHCTSAEACHSLGAQLVLIKHIGSAFDEELAAGKHDALFTANF